MGRLLTNVANLLEGKPRVIRLDEKVGDSEAAYDLAVTTHRFSKRAREMVDDKLSLSATLMRAGEVSEAQRLLAEAEADLRAEEAELMRQIDELDTYRELHQQRVVVLDRPSRGSLVRTLAVAVASSAVIALATMGGAVVGLFEPKAPIRRTSVPSFDSVGTQAARAIQSASARRGIAVVINGIELVLTRAEWRALKKVQRSGDEEALNDLLDVIAPELTASASGELIEAITSTGALLETTVRQAKEPAEEAAASSTDSDGNDAGSDAAEPAPSGSPPPPEDGSEEPTATEEPPAEEEPDGGSPEDGGDEPGTIQEGLGTTVDSRGLGGGTDDD